MLPGADKFCVVAMGVGGNSGMEVKLPLWGNLRTEMLKAGSHPR